MGGAKPKLPAAGQYVLIGHGHWAEPDKWWIGKVEWASPDEVLVLDYRHGHSRPLTFMTGWNSIIAYGDPEALEGVHRVARDAYFRHLPAIRDANVALSAALDALRVDVQACVADTQLQASLAKALTVGGGGLRL
jgi:hypothetical protein